MKKSNKRMTVAPEPGQYERLEPRKLLAADISVAGLATDAGLGDYTENRLIYQIPEPVPVNQRMDLLADFFDLEETDSFRKVSLNRDHLGFGHVKYQQYMNGLPVEGAFFTVHARNREVVGLSGHFVENTGEAFASSALSEQDALAFALADINADSYIWQDPTSANTAHFHVHSGDTTHIHLGSHSDDTGGGGHEPGCGCPNCAAKADTSSTPMANNELSFEVPEGELVYFDTGDGAPRLAYKFDIYALEPLSRDYVFVDTHSGEILEKYNRIHTADAPATGTSLYNGTVSFVADDTGANFRLRQQVNGVETFNLNNGTNYGAATDITSPTNAFTATNVHNGVQAHFGAEQTLDYFLTRHGRDSYDNQGTTLFSYVSYGNNYVNAFWNGTAMTYGDGNGSTIGPLTSLDIVGHEIAHGVTQFSAGLIYQNQSGALNESFSDIFGEAVENYASGANDWLMGDDIGLTGSGAFRSMSNPNQYGDPDTYLGDFWYTGSGDNGGVHINSGVQNKWFYILTEGESGTNDFGFSYNVTGIGMEDAAEIAYRNLTVYLNPSSDYPEAREGAVQSAIDLFGAGSQQHLSTMAAWDAVGVYQPVIDLDFQQLPSPGSLIYRDEDSGSINLAGDVESIPLFIDAGQRISIVAERTAGTLVPSLEVLDPAGTTIATTTGIGPMTILQNVELPVSGEYTINLTGASDTTGDFDAQFYLNAALEAEGLGFPNNDSLVNAQDLEDSSIALGLSGAQRLAVLGGEGLSSTTVIDEGFESGELGSEWTTTTSHPNGRIIITDIAGSAAGDNALLMDVNQDGFFSLNEAVLTVDLSEYGSSNLSFYHAEFGDETHSLPASFTGSFNGDGVAISDDGIVWYTILTSMAGGSGVYNFESFDIAALADQFGLEMNSNFQIKFQQFDNFAFSSDGRSWDEIRIDAGLPSEDWYSFQLEDGQSTSVMVENYAGDPNAIMELELYDSLGVLLETGAFADGVAHIPNYVNESGMTDTFYVKINAQEVTYALVVNKDAVFAVEPNDQANPIAISIDGPTGMLGHVRGNSNWTADPDQFANGTVLDTLFPEVILSNNLSTDGIFGATASFGAPTGNLVFAPAEGAADGFREGDNELRADFTIPQSVVSIDIGSDDGSDVGFLRAYDASDTLLEEVVSGSLSTGQSETLTISRAQADIAYVIAAGVSGDITPIDNLTYENFDLDEDYFSFDVTEPIKLDFVGYLPGEGPFEFENRLDLAGGSDLRMELIDPNGVVVATEANRLTYDTVELGTYQLRVYGATSLGEYYIQSNPGPVIPMFIDFGPTDSPVEEGFTQVGANAYTPGVGYGWTQTVGLGMFEQTLGSDLARDKAVMREGTFLVDVDNGTYDITIHFGTVRRRTEAQITIEGATDTFFPNLGPNVTRTYQAIVSDGQLAFEFDGNLSLDRRIRIAGISIEESQSNLLMAWNPSQHSFASKSATAPTASQWTLDSKAVTGLAGAIDVKTPESNESFVDSEDGKSIDNAFELFDDFAMAF